MTSCSPVDKADLEATARVMAITMNYETIQALPATATPEVYPTATWMPTATRWIIAPITPTSTLDAASPGGTSEMMEFTSTPNETSNTTTLEATLTPGGSLPTYTPLPFMAAWKVSSIRFVNNSGKTVKFTLYGAEVIDLTVGKTLIVKVRFDTYDFTAYIGKGGPYNGSIFINNMDRYTIFIDEDNIRVAYP